MFHNKGMTLIESLFAFSIYIIIIVLFVSLMSSMNKSYLKYKNRIEVVETNQGDDTISLIKEVLH